MKIFLKLLIALTLLVGCKSEPKQADYNIIPLPSNIEANEGKPFILNKNTKISYPKGNDMMKNNAEFLALFLNQITGVNYAVTTEDEKENAIILNLDLTNDNNEAYRIVTNEKSITISGVAENGVFYGIQTLRKSTPITQDNISYPATIINDQPRFAYRGMMLDVARHFEPVEFIKKYIDILALHNINRFHWHLTEDQGWRIEIKKYPKLTEIGSKRKETVIGKNTAQYNGEPHEGFYTQEEIKEIVDYAQARYITIIPEIDLPGHMLAALASYPELGCTGGPYEVGQIWGVYDDVLCPGKEETFTFLEDVLTEVMELFPSEYIHIGGDECPKVRWEKCPLCQARIKELGLKDDKKHKKEHYLQSYVTERIETFLNKNGRKIIGWDEILEGKLAPNATVMSWRGVAGGIEAAQMGHDVIMSPNSHAYFDHYQTKKTDKEPLAIGGYTSVEKVYSFEPVPSELNAEESKHIIGLQANLWTEYVPNSDHAEYMTMPRIAALCEVQWVDPKKKDYKNFINRLNNFVQLYDKLGYNYAKHIYEVNAEYTIDSIANNMQISLSPLDDAIIYYTLDGTEPTASSIKYTTPIEINSNTILKAVSITNGNRGRVFEETVRVSKSSFKPITLTHAPAKRYKYRGANMLIDGINGTTEKYNSEQWLGFIGNPLIATIDLLEDTEISKAEINSCVNTYDWVFDAESIEIEASSDGKEFISVVKESYTDERGGNWNEIVKRGFNFAPVKARYFRITVTPTASIPEWHGGKGRRGFVFVDEIRLD